MANSKKLTIAELEFVKIAMERVENRLKNVRNAKEEDKLYKCYRWDQECISKFKKDVMTVKDKVKLLVKEENVKFVWVKKFSKKRKLWKFLLTKVFLIIHLFLLQEKEIKSYLFFNI